MTAVQTWTVAAPSSRNSTASCQAWMPPMPLIGTPIAGSAATAATMLSAIGLTAGPQ